jgi:anti-anti-sigma regulatory factor
MTTILLPVDCSRDAALALWPQLQAARQEVIIDGSAVEKIGQIMLQVLLMAGGHGVIANPSPALEEAITLTGLRARLLEGVGR